MDTILDKIIEFTDNAHDGQQRKYTGGRYIIHPIRVMNICRGYTADLPVLAAALLHDVLEDTTVNKDEILEFLFGVMDTRAASRTFQLVDELTDVYIKKAYPQWNRKKRKAMEAERIARISPTAQTIKYADILDNCQDIINHDPNFGPLFLIESLNLLNKANKGNAALRQHVLETVQAGFRSL